MTTYCTFSLSDDVAERLDEDDIENKSEAVDNAVREVFDV